MIYEAEFQPVLLATGRYEKLLNEVCQEKKWRKDTWDLVERRLREEAQFMHECDPSATFAYAAVVEIACTYLASVHDRDLYERFLGITSADATRFYVSFNTVENGGISENDQWILDTAMRLFYLRLGELHKFYPDTH